MSKTPLELALERETEIDYCDQCEHIRVVKGTGYCGISGKILHPMMLERVEGGVGYGPARHCDHRIRPEAAEHIGG